ncbi:MAG: hypothetical protein AAGK05_19640, partial [Pseudomonadota bacterium]
LSDKKWSNCSLFAKSTKIGTDDNQVILNHYRLGPISDLALFGCEGLLFKMTAIRMKKGFNSF